MISDSYLDELKEKHPLSLKKEKSGNIISPQLETLETIKNKLIEAVKLYNELKSTEIWFIDIFRNAFEKFNETYSLASAFAHNYSPAMSSNEIIKQQNDIEVLKKNINNLLLGENFNIISLYSYYTLQKQNSTAKEAADKIANISDIEGRAKSILESLQIKAANEISLEYAQIFLNQSKLHSEALTPKKIPFLSASTKWLFTGIIIAFISIMLLISDFTFLEFLQIDYTKTNIEIFSIWIKRISILGILLYITQFSFSQYSINKHLATVNKHKANSLNTFKLFLDSISKDDNQTKNTLLIEIAKTIFDIGQTGFLNQDKTDLKYPTVMEITKYFNQDTK
ncbi:hypothetical protein EHQ94_02135 [Leptospira meyeri]|uniref:hypothetical protein n=1 Tax=Leptospira meyeri TaxID=29508 RepID=UPI001084647D|nr:hypothetical protein [Leptospira meyeri]TGM65859.1 hypothetical protein EHQ93_08915 [Leptospira meyeri]TGM72071.1 hypothetical protein EHQ94_02135 [Leptospira meyeri]